MSKISESCRKIVGYERISTIKQSFDRQNSNIIRFAKENGYEVEKIYREVISGNVFVQERPILLEACRFCNEHGFMMVIDGIDRLSRNVEIPIRFTMMKERGDFDIEIICDISHKKSISIEDLCFATIEHGDLILEMLTLNGGMDSFKELCASIKQ